VKKIENFTPFCHFGPPKNRHLLMRLRRSRIFSGSFAAAIFRRKVLGPSVSEICYDLLLAGPLSEREVPYGTSCLLLCCCRGSCSTAGVATAEVAATVASGRVVLERSLRQGSVRRMPQLGMRERTHEHRRPKTECMIPRESSTGQKDTRRMQQPRQTSNGDRRAAKA